MIPSFTNECIVGGSTDRNSDEDVPVVVEGTIKKILIVLQIVVIKSIEV